MSPKKTRITKAINGLNVTRIMSSFNRNSGITDEGTANTEAIERELRDNFRSFLSSADMPLASKNFDALLAEKSGSKYRRNDGTVSWYHELIPILMIIEMARLGKKCGGFDLSDLDRYGGLEVLICTHLRHDSVEDYKDPDVLKKDLQQMIAEIRLEHPSYDVDRARGMASMILNNVNLMSQQRLYNPDGSKIIVNGKHAKEDVKTYTKRMIYDENSNPIVFMLKQCDIIINSATMLGAEKFSDPFKRMQKFNNYEDMYGPRNGFTDTARKKWPAFSPAINTLDSMMGFILYPHFRYLESVDLAYPDKVPTDNPVGISRFYTGATRLKLAEGLHPIHIFLKRMITSNDVGHDQQRAERLESFMTNVIGGALKDLKASEFPYVPRPADSSATGLSGAVVR